MNTRIGVPTKEDTEEYLNKKPEEYLTFREKIKCARINYKSPKKPIGLSITLAAKKIKISKVHLSQLENGKRVTPGAVVMSKIETFYNFQPGELSKVLAESAKN